MALGGITAGTTAGYLSHAFDTVKTRQQTLSPDFYPRGFFPSFEVAKYIVKNEGYMALMKGAPYRAGCIALSGVFIANGPRAVAELSEKFCTENDEPNLPEESKPKYSPWSYPWS